MLGPAGRNPRIGPAVLTLLAALGMLLAAASARAQSFPPLTGRVVDAANVIPPDAEARLTGKLEALQAQSQRQLVVATIPSLEGYDIADYSNRLFRSWQLGDKQRNDGALLVVAPNDRKVRIEVGYGLEGIVTDGLSSLIIQNTIIPRFKAGDMPGGIEAGADLLIRQLSLPEGEARIQAAQAQPNVEHAPDVWPLFFFAFLFLVVFVLPAIGSARRRGGYRPSGLGSIILWSVVDAIGRGSSSSSSGGGWSGGGGGFSGGGGSSGGGGASGSW